MQVQACPRKKRRVGIIWVLTTDADPRDVTLENVIAQRMHTHTFYVVPSIAFIAADGSLAPLCSFCADNAGEFRLIGTWIGVQVARLHQQNHGVE